MKNLVLALIPVEHNRDTWDTAHVSRGTKCLGTKYWYERQPSAIFSLSWSGTTAGR